MLPRRISSQHLRSVLVALALLASHCLLNTMRAQELPTAPSSFAAAGTLPANRTMIAAPLSRTGSLFLTTPGAGHWSLFLTTVPPGGLHPVSPLLSSGFQYRAANPFALPTQGTATNSSSFALGGGFNLSAGVAHRQGGSAGAMPLSGLSVSTRTTSGMDFSLSGGFASGGGFNSGSFGPSSDGFSNRTLTGGSPSGGATPQLLLRLKF